MRVHQKQIHEVFAPYNDAGANIIFGADMNMRPGDPTMDSVYEPSYGDDGCPSTTCSSTTSR